jgi:hypothetical protein
MQRMACWECSRDTATPQADPPSVDRTVFEFAICLDCLDRLRQDGEGAREAGEAIRAGTVCGLCLSPLDPSVGYVVWSFDEAHLLRLCAGCKEKVEWGHRDQKP